MSASDKNNLRKGECVLGHREKTLRETVDLPSATGTQQSEKHTGKSFAECHRRNSSLYLHFEGKQLFA